MFASSDPQKQKEFPSATDDSRCPHNRPASLASQSRRNAMVWNRKNQKWRHWAWIVNPQEWAHHPLRRRSSNRCHHQRRISCSPSIHSKTIFTVGTWKVHGAFGIQEKRPHFLFDWRNLILQVQQGKQAKWRYLCSVSWWVWRRSWMYRAGMQTHVPQKMHQPLVENEAKLSHVQEGCED